LNSQQSLLIVDDDMNVLEVLEARLSSAGYTVHKASGANYALEILKSRHVDLMISDMKMPGMDGMELFTEARSVCPGLPVIFLTAYGTIPDAVRAVKAGAVDYLAKPFHGRDLLTKLREILDGVMLRVIQDQTPVEDEGLYKGKSPLMKELYYLVERVAASNVNVLILGESGVGKERVAQIIHQYGSRRDYPFIAVNCGSTPTGLLESELFGHLRGSFTHAIHDKKGLIEAADRGTLFLDEIGNISNEMQIRLLRFLEERKIRKIGDLKEIPVDCRVISATNSNLLESIEAGNFREDLYYRLRVVTLKIPPLRERKEDIPLLAQEFVDAFCTKQQISPVSLLPETIEWLCKYPWPGNVRELKNALEAGIVLCKNGTLNPSALHLTGLPEAPSSAASMVNPFSLEESERNTILRALKQTGGIQKDAAKLLGISRRAIHYKIKKFGIKVAEIRSGGEDSA
jgi:DNA-binding NtrC family response regulator